ncbi:MAG: hypothetical protein Q8Q23_04250 [bacterium]|nr:hypothetical protein [bacterium]
MYYKLEKLVLTPTSGKPSSTAEVFISNPQIDQEAILGKLFFACEIESVKSDALKIINFFISALPNNYYQSEKISLREKMGKINIATLFENSIARVNAEFEKFAKKERVKIDGKKVNLVAGVITKSELIYSTVGSMRAMLIHTEGKSENAESLITAGEANKKIYKIAVIEENETRKKVDFSKIFSNVTEGKIPLEGYFVFTNDILPEYISNKHLSKIITTLPLPSAVEQIKSQLHKINNYVTFVGIIIKNSSQPQIKRSIPKMQLHVTANNSLEEMQSTENRTSKYLSPFGAINKDRIINFFKKNTIGLLKSGGYPRENSTIRDKIFLTRKSPFRVILRFSNYLKNLFSLIINIFFYLIQISLHPVLLIRKISLLTKIILSKILGFFSFLYFWYKKLSPISKTWLVIFVICASLFTYNIYSITGSKNQQINEVSYQEKVQTIQQKQNQIEAALLYKDEEKAKALIEETAGLITELNSYEKIDGRLIETLLSKNAEQLKKISHVITIDPQELIDFSNLEKNSQPQSMALVDTIVIAANPKTGTLFQYNIKDKTASNFALTKNINFGAQPDSDEAIFISAQGGVRVDKTGIIQTIDEKIIDSLNEINDIAYFNSRLYVLSAANNNILRFAKNFDTYEEWVKENIDLSNAASVAIDGYIYVLKNNGEVLKFLSGYTNKFELSKINPPLTSPTKIKLTGDSEAGQIYILEPSANRIAVFSKEGKFITQYQLENLTDLKDFLVIKNNDAKSVNAKDKILLLSGSKIYEIETSAIK